MPHVAYEVYAFTYDDRTINSLHKVLYPVLNSHNLVNTFFMKWNVEQHQSIHLKYKQCQTK